MNALISTKELHDLIGKKGVKILDASYGQPPVDMCIGPAIDFDIDVVADKDAVLPHTLPRPEVFAAHASVLGLANDDHIIVYDRSGLAMAASRAWWMFRIFGHEKVQILDGGFPAWLKAGYEISSKKNVKKPERTAYAVKYQPHLYKSRQDILDNIDKQAFTVIDARDAKRYSGEAAEPRPGMQGGHIPGSLNVPYATLIDPATGLFKNLEQVKEALQHIDNTKPLAVSCGSGVTACVVALGLYQLGKKDVAIYDGSWAEWGGDLSTPKKKGNAP